MTKLELKDGMPKTVKILDVKDENPFVKTFTLDISLGAEPGQFCMLWIPRLDEKPFSIAYDDGETMQFSVAKVGEFTERLHEMKAGDTVGVRGPYGSVFEYGENEHVAVVGGGYGAAPLYYIADKIIQSGGEVEFIVGARSSEYLMFLDRAEKLANTTVHVATDDGSQGYEGYNTALLEKLFDEGLAVDRIITVGPEGMMKAVSDIALQHDISCQVSVERYMKCGFGVCGQCVIDDSGITTCIGGPAMDHKLAREHTEFGSYHRDRVGRKHKF